MNYDSYFYEIENELYTHIFMNLVNAVYSVSIEIFNVHTHEYTCTRTHTRNATRM